MFRTLSSHSSYLIFIFNEMVILVPQYYLVKMVFAKDNKEDKNNRAFSSITESAEGFFGCNHMFICRYEIERIYIRREHVRPALRFLIRVLIAVGVILFVDVIGLWVFLSSREKWTLLNFTELLTILLLLEGSLIGAAGGFMFVGYSEYRIAKQNLINPAIVGDQRQRWRERRLSQQKWGFAMLIAGVLLIFLGLLVSFLTSL